MTGSLTPIRLALLRNYTAEPILPWLKREFAARGLEPHCRIGEFSDAMGDIHALSKAQGEDSAIDMVVLTLSLELYSREFGHADWKCSEACAHVLSLVEAAVERCSRPIVLNTLLPPLFPAFGFAAEPGRHDHAYEVEALNLQLRRIAASQPGKVVLLDWVAYARELGADNTYDPRFWYTSGLPFAVPFLKRFAAGLAGVAEVLAGRARKCLVLDCDNTLWGGVVGEDGPGGVALSADTLPGAYFQEFQRSVLDLHRQGVLLALCSKNDEADVFEVLERHPACLLRREHLAAWRIDWNDKAASLVAIASELNIGLDALVFVDDSPMECERVRQALPAIRVIQVPGQPAELPGFLHRLRPFPALVHTVADANRTASYQDNRKRGELADAAGDVAEYRRMLGTRIRPRVAGEADLDRITQLFQKTNQFNLTTRRHDRGEVGRMAEDPDSLVFCAEVADKFGDLGLVAVAVARRDHRDARIDSFLLSCRALGRDAEFAFLASFATAIRDRWAIERLHAVYLPTNKNAQVADFWSRAGFGPAPPGSTDGVFYTADDLELLIENNRRDYVVDED